MLESIRAELEKLFDSSVGGSGQLRDIIMPHRTAKV